MGRLPVLSHLYPGGKSGKYKPVEVQRKDSERQLADHSGLMAGRYRQTKEDVGPPQKRRKTEEAEDDDELWDDSMEFSQVDLEDLDRGIQASQAASSKVTTKPKAEEVAAQPYSFHLPSTSTGQVTPQSHQVSSSRSSSSATQPSRDTTGTFLKPQLSRSTSSSSTSLNGSHVTSHSGHSSYSHSSSHSSHSSYPSSLSDSHSSSYSIKSGSSSDRGFPVRQSGSLTGVTSAESLDVTGILGRQHSGDRSVRAEGHQQPVKDKNQQDIEDLKRQLTNLKEEVCVKEGENKLLRDNLSRRDTEIDELKMEKINQINQQNKQQSLKEKNLQNELAKLQTQLQFKHQEEREMADKYHELESQIKHLQPLASSSQVSPGPQMSPKPRRIPVDDRSPKGGSHFPTTQSFLSTVTVSPVKKVKTRETGVQSEMVSAATGSMERLQVKPPALKLKVSGSVRLSGSHLVAKLLDVPPSTTGRISDRGIVGLLNTPSTSASLYSIKFDRDRDTSLLSPVANKRLSDFRSLISQYDSGETVGLTDPEHYNMAIQGLTHLLRCVDTDSAHEKTRERTSHQGPRPMLPHTSQGRQAYDGQTQREYIFGESNLDSAILILPLIHDYLQHYIEMFESVLESNNTSLVTASSKSSSSESFDTSSESPTGSLGVLLQTTANYANDLESLAMASLHTMNLLVMCEAVRQVLLQSSDAETPTQKPPVGGRDGTSTGKVQQFPLKTVCRCNMLRKIIRLSNPGSKGHLYNTRIVESSLSVLTVLAQHANTDKVNSLLPVLSEEGIQNSLECETEPGIVIHALVLLKALAKNNLVVSSLCSNTTGCVLLSVYGLCGVDKCLTAMNVVDKLQVLHLIIELLSYIASCHKGGLTVILESDCQCSVEVVKTLVCILHSVLLVHKENKSIDCDPTSTISTHIPSQPRSEDSLGREKLRRTSLDLLQDGLLLLHLMYQHDTGFTARHTSVQHQYVQLICGLSHIFKPMENNEFEMNALQDLWDYPQDDAELYPSDDENQSMDTST